MLFLLPLNEGLPCAMDKQDIRTDRPDFNTVLALGANLPTAAGGPLPTVRAAIKCLTGAGFTLGSVSHLYATPAHPPGSGPEFVNAVALCATDLDPAAALAALHRIESDFGRDRAGRWAPRPLDLDLVAMGDAVCPDRASQARWRALPPERQVLEAPAELILPHPRLQDRAFVLVPMAEVAPGWRHPLLGLDVREMLARLPAAALEGIRTLE